MSYAPPKLNGIVVIVGDYSTPSLFAPVVLCPANEHSGGALHLEIHAPLPSVAISVAGRADYVAELGLSASAPLPNASVSIGQQPARTAPDMWALAAAQNAHALPAALGASGAHGYRAGLFVAPPAPQPAAIFLGLDRVFLAAIAATTAPLVSAPAITASGVMVSVSAVAAISAPVVTAPEIAAKSKMDIALPDADGAGLVSRAQQARRCTAPMAFAQRSMLDAQRPARIAQRSSLPAAFGSRQAHAETLRTRCQPRESHTHGLPLARGARVASAETLRCRRDMALAEARSALCRAGSRLAHAERLRSRRRGGLPHVDAPTAWQRLLAVQHTAWPTAAPLFVRWHHADKPRPGIWWPGGDGPPTFVVILRRDNCIPRPLRCPVVLGGVQPPCPADPPPGSVIIPVREVYFVINSTSVVRASDGLPIETGNFSATLDVDSWCWSWSASLAAELRPLVASPVRGEHVELIATINGTALRLVVEKIGRDRRFAGATLKISGRGRAAWLADPHSPVQSRYNTVARTAQQLLVDALTINDVAIGWGVDWRIADWNVSSGAWSQSGTYIEAAQRIAEAGGGYVQAHNTDQTLIVLPRYPAAPWHWAGLTPDIVLPEDVCEVEGIEWQDKAAYNAVYVVGGEHGRADRVLRAGTAADAMAPTIVDPLATAPEMTRQRGLACIADTGRQAHITLRLPVLPETGIIQPGKLIDYTEGGITRRGLSRAVTVDQAFPSVWQSIRIETHELEPV